MSDHPKCKNCGGNAWIGRDYCPTCAHDELDKRDAEIAIQDAELCKLALFICDIVETVQKAFSTVQDVAKRQMKKEAVK